MTCEDCHIERQFPGYIQFTPNCLYCGARLIQFIQRCRPLPTVEETTAEQIKQRCRTVLADWMAYGHSEQEIRALAKGARAIEPAPERSQGRKR